MIEDLFSGIEASLERVPKGTASAVRESIALARSLGIGTVAGLIDAIGDAATERRLKLSACELLGRFAQDLVAAQPCLAHLVAESADVELIWGAARSLAMSFHISDSESIVAALREGEPENSAAAAWLLGQTGVASAVPALREAVRDLSRSAKVRGYSAEALGMLKSSDAIDDLLSALSDANPEIRYWAAYALGQIGDARALPRLEELANTDSAAAGHGTVGSEAADAIDQILSSRP